MGKLPFIPTSETANPTMDAGAYRSPLDLHRLLVARPASTFVLRSRSSRHGVQAGDLLVVDRSIRPGNGALVIAVEEGNLVLARFPVAEVWGRVQYVIHQP